MRKILFYVSLLVLFGLSFGQELFIQNSGELKGSERVSGQEYTTVYDNVNHTYRYFDALGNEIFLIEGARDCGHSPVQQYCKTSMASVGIPFSPNNPYHVLVYSCFWPHKKANDPIQVDLYGPIFSEYLLRYEAAFSVLFCSIEDPQIVFSISQ